MANITITEQQLESWAKYIQLNKNTETYDKVKEIFKGELFEQKDNFEIYLQGSVANNTNIWADGDIDIVFQFNGTFSNNAKEKLFPADYQLFKDKYPDSSYTLSQLRDNIKRVLAKKAIRYREKNKCIELNLKGEHWQDVDLVPCFQYRYYNYFDEYLEGIKIQTLEKETIINYPKIHKANGEAKNQSTGNYKKIVRIFKNIKKRLIEESYIDETLAPSYFIECLIYNIPNKEFDENNLTTLLCNCLNWLESQDLENLKCQNSITDLFGTESTEWNLNDCNTFIEETIKYVTK